MSPLIRMATLLLMLSMPAHAQDLQQLPVEVGEGPICDTQQQAERLAALYPVEAPDAVRQVNAETDNPSACGIANLAYVRSAPLATVRTGDATFEIVKVLVLGVVTEKGVEAADPVVFYSLFKIDERVA
jgi:hypothetical protein